ncbi:MAG: class I SAM-dependent methyltransferase [Promethearchaeota archaeon]|jgi:SAM-dependent methyltransferase
MEKKEIVRTGYNKAAEKLQVIFSQDPEGYEKFLQDESDRVNLLTEFISRVPLNGQVLDAGCGNGAYSRYLSEKFKVIGIDISEKQIELAKQNAPKAEFICEDMTKMDFPKEFFNGIIAFYSIIHVPREEQQALLSKFYDILNLKGVALLTFHLNDDPGFYIKNFFDTGEGMYWSGFNKKANLNMVKKVGFKIIWAKSVKESEKWGENSHLFVFAEK